MYLRRCLAFLEVGWSFVVQAKHIRGVDNVMADALSRDKVELARSLMEEAGTRPTSLPKDVVEAVAKIGITNDEVVWETLWQPLQSKGWQTPPDIALPQAGQGA